MKAQVSFIEFYVSLTVFVLFATYIFFQVSTILPSHVREINSQILHSEAYQLSELLVNDPGEPSNWDTLSDLAQIRRIGLLDQTQNKTNLLLLSKITRLNIICNSLGGYDTIRSKLATTDQLSITIINKVSNTIVASCFPPTVTSPILLVNLTRIVVFSGNNGELVLQLGLV